jgi:hypothetical protein
VFIDLVKIIFTLIKITKFQVIFIGVRSTLSLGVKTLWFCWFLTLQTPRPNPSLLVTLIISVSLTTTTLIATSPPYLNLAAIGSLTRPSQVPISMTQIIETPSQVCAHSSASMFA